MEPVPDEASTVASKRSISPAGETVSKSERKKREDNALAPLPFHVPFEY
jgi:hypothetical protein